MKWAVHSILLLGVICGLSSAEDVKRDHDVYVLDTENFDKFIADNPSVLVMFYAPWCSKSQALLPRFSSAAEVAVAMRLDSKLAKVDGDREKELTKKYKIGGWPVVRFFRNGQMEGYEGGQSTEDFLRWLIKNGNGFKHLE